MRVEWYMSHKTRAVGDGASVCESNVLRLANNAHIAGLVLDDLRHYSFLKKVVVVLNLPRSKDVSPQRLWTEAAIECDCPDIDANIGPFHKIRYQSHRLREYLLRGSVVSFWRDPVSLSCWLWMRMMELMKVGYW